MLDVRRLALLREVRLRGSVTSAAAALGLSASAVSQQITRLEADVATPLLEAAGRGIKLTPEAERLVDYAERVLATLEEAETELGARVKGLSGVVRLASFQSFALSLLGPTVRRLAESAPHLELEFVQLDPERAVAELSARRVDLVVADEYPGVPITPVPGLVRRTLVSDPIRAFLPAAMPLPRERHQGEWHSADLAAVPWVFEPRGSSSYDWAVGVCRSAGFEPRVRYESPDLSVHERLVQEGAAAAFLPRSLSGAGPTSARLLPGFPDDLSRTLFALMRRGAERSPTISACLAAIGDTLGLPSPKDAKSGRGSSKDPRPLQTAVPSRPVTRTTW